jgi:hypothetical protein
MNVKHSVEWELARKTEILGENLPQPLCPPQIPHDLTLARIRSATLRSRRLTAWAMARPHCLTSAVVCARCFWAKNRFMGTCEMSFKFYRPHVTRFLRVDSLMVVYNSRPWNTAALQDNVSREQPLPQRQCHMCEQQDGHQSWALVANAQSFAVFHTHVSFCGSVTSCHIWSPWNVVSVQRH